MNECSADFLKLVHKKTCSFPSPVFGIILLRNSVLEKAQGNGEYEFVRESTLLDFAVFGACFISDTKEK